MTNLHSPEVLGELLIGADLLCIGFVLFDLQRGEASRDPAQGGNDSCLVSCHKFIFNICTQERSDGVLGFWGDRKSVV